MRRLRPGFSGAMHSLFVGMWAMFEFGRHMAGLALDVLVRHIRRVLGNPLANGNAIFLPSLAQLHQRMTANVISRPGDGDFRDVVSAQSSSS